MRFRNLFSDQRLTCSVYGVFVQIFCCSHLQAIPSKEGHLFLKPGDKKWQPPDRYKLQVNFSLLSNAYNFFMELMRQRKLWDRMPCNKVNYEAGDEDGARYSNQICWL